MTVCTSTRTTTIISNGMMVRRSLLTWGLFLSGMKPGRAALRLPVLVCSVCWGLPIRALLLTVRTQVRQPMAKQAFSVQGANPRRSSDSPMAPSVVVGGTQVRVGRAELDPRRVRRLLRTAQRRSVRRRSVPPGDDGRERRLTWRPAQAPVCQHGVGGAAVCSEFSPLTGTGDMCAGPLARLAGGDWRGVRGVQRRLKAARTGRAQPDHSRVSLLSPTAHVAHPRAVLPSYAERGSCAGGLTQSAESLLGRLHSTGIGGMS